MRGYGLGLPHLRAIPPNLPSASCLWLRSVETLTPKPQPRMPNPARFYVRYSPLILTYSALRSHVQTVAEPDPPLPRLTSMSISLPVR